MNEASRRLLVRLVLLLTAALLVVAVPGVASAKGKPAGKGKGETTTEPVVTEPVVTEPTADHHPRLGVFTPGAPGDPVDLAAFSDAAGARPRLVTFFAAWGTVADFPAADAARIAAAGAVPEVTWEPWHPAKGANQKTYSAARIASGAHDAYIDRWARQVVQYGGPLRIRFMHEANGDWYPWSVGGGRNSAADHVAAWRRVHQRFAAAGATNVAWVWAPNVPYPGSAPLAAMFPGDAHVDLVGLDGYNFGLSQPWSAWISPQDLFGPGLGELAELSARPVVLAEVASTEVGGDKAAWVADFFALLARNPQVRSFTWFDVDKETDWRVASSEASRDAFRAGLASVV